jgi:pimeloyl-ACP methyl ester carboxylesterase
MNAQVVRIPSAGDIAIEAVLHLPHLPSGVVVFAPASFERRNRAIACALARRDFATLVLDLQIGEEDAHDIGLVSRCVVDAIDWLRRHAGLEHMPAALFGDGAGAAAALVAAAERLELVHALISHDGRPELAGEALPRVEAPTLLVVGEADGPLVELNRDAMRRMRAHVELEIAPEGAVAQLALEWYQRYLWSMA